MDDEGCLAVHLTDGVNLLLVYLSSRREALLLECLAAAYPDAVDVPRRDSRAWLVRHQHRVEGRLAQRLEVHALVHLPGGHIGGGKGQVQVVVISRRVYGAAVDLGVGDHHPQHPRGELAHIGRSDHREAHPYRLRLALLGRDGVDDVRQLDDELLADGIHYDVLLEERDGVEAGAGRHREPVARGDEGRAEAVAFKEERKDIPYGLVAELAVAVFKPDSGHFPGGAFIHACDRHKVLH